MREREGRMVRQHASMVLTALCKVYMCKEQIRQSFAGNVFVHEWMGSDRPISYHSLNHLAVALFLHDSFLHRVV